MHRSKRYKVLYGFFVLSEFASLNIVKRYIRKAMLIYRRLVNIHKLGKHCAVSGAGDLWLTNC